jgi:hypothetical protein
MIGKGVQSIQKRQITSYAYKVAKGMMPKISGKTENLKPFNPRSLLLSTLLWGIRDGARRFERWNR